MKIRTAIFATYALASAVGLAVLMRFVLAEVRPRHTASIERTMQESANLLAEALAALPPAEWPAAVERMSGSVAGLQLQVLDDAGRPLSGAAELAVSPDSYDDKRYQGTRNRLSSLIDNQPYVTDGRIEVRAEVTVAGNRAGTVVLGRPLRTVNSYIWAERKKLAVGALLIALFMLALGWWLSDKLTGSLARLARHARAVRDGEASTPPQSRAMEVNELADAFEGMRRTLEGRDFVHHYTQNLAHELKSPIAGIRGAAELLQEPEMPAEDRARFVGNIQRETERLQQIVERVMRLATLQSEGAGELTGTVEIAGVLEEIARTMEPEVNAKNLTWEVRMEPEVRVRGDRFLIYHALINLALNAVDFSPAGGRVVVVVRVEGPSGLLEVCDEGPGVPDYALPRVFERFYSLPRPHGGAKSTGLGLSFVREIAALHGGEAGLVNVPGGGTRAWLRLPGA